MLPATLRISARRDFARIFSKGLFLSTPIFFVRALASSLEKPRVGIVVSNKISKKAVVRNLIKRRLRAAAYKQRDLISTPTDIIIITKPAIVDANYEQIDNQVVYAFSNLTRARPHNPRQRQ